MKNLIQQYLALELVTPHQHQRNVAEVAIRALKQHFLSIIVGVATDFPMHQWERLPPQAKLPIKLLWKSNTAPTVLAYVEMFRPFNYNRITLGPMGCAVLIHEKPML